MKYDTDKINKLDILEVATKLGLEIFPIQKSIRCVRHSPDNHPSMKLDIKRNRLKCFSCGISLNVIDLVKEVNSVDFLPACLWIYQQYSWTILNSRAKIVTTKRNAIKTTPVEKKVCKNKSSSLIYQWIIDNSSLSLNSRKFLFEERKFSEDIIVKQNIKSIVNYKEFRNVAIDKWTSNLLDSSGFSGIGMGGAWYIESLLIPYYNFNGEIIQIQARGLNTSEKNKRFAFLKGVETTIYNIQLLKNLNSRDKVYIFEGVTDCLAALSFGLNAIAIPGAGAYKDEYVEILKDFDLYMIPDNDLAGNLLLEKIEASFVPLCKCIHRLTLPNGYKDFCEYYIDFKDGKIN